MCGRIIVRWLSFEFDAAIDESFKSRHHFQKVDWQMQVLLQDKNSTKDIVTNLGSAALISFILVLPFAILESLFNVVNKQNAFGLIVLFGLLWLLTIAFIVILVPVVRTVRAGNNIMANPLNLLFRVVFLILIAMMLGGILIDQLPCFLGVPNCD